MNRSVRHGGAIALLIAALLLPAALGAQEVDYKKFIAEKAPAIVAVKMVLTIEGGIGGRTQERETSLDLTGVVVDESGLVMIAADALTAAQRARNPARPGGEGGAIEVNVKPSNVRVVIPGEEREHPALLVATDSNLNLAFVQILELGERKLAAVPFDPEARAEVGEELIGVGRHGQTFDHAPFFGTVRVTGEIEQPRAMYSFDGRFAERGIPLFTRSGKAVGVLSSPGGLEPEGAVPAGGGGGGRGGRGGFGGFGRAPGTASAFLIPAAQVHALVDQAKVQAKTAKEHGKTEPDA
jgi:hypothetical protein